MATSVVPALIDALVSQSRAVLPDVIVYDGFGVSDDPGEFLMVGVSDDTDTASRAVSSHQEWANANHTARDESGDVTCMAVSWNGDADQKAARDGVYATKGAVEDMLRADPDLGLDNVLWTSAGTDENLDQNQDDAGALAILTFTIAYRARL
jgi:hypothetical protein